MVSYTEQSQNTKDDYATDPELWRPISNAIGGFDLDPATSAEHTRIADEIYTPEDDGLSKSWHGSVWLNPPFSNKIKWYRKTVNEVTSGNVELAVVVAPGDNSADWFQRWFSKAELLAWLNGRDWYSGPGQPSFNTVVGVFGTCPDEIVEVLDSVGVVTKPVRVATQTTL